MPSKRKRKFEQPPCIHPRNKYAEKAPDFQLLASLYPAFQPFVSYSQNGRPKIDWTDFNATRELTRVLLHHDHGINWWIPDGQLCPTVPNRSNYIHWIEDLLASKVIPKQKFGDRVRGFDIGTGANCIYPLLGASLLGWSFVGSDVTEISIESARKNVESNPHIANLIEIRVAGECESMISNGKGKQGEEIYENCSCSNEVKLSSDQVVEVERLEENEGLIYVVEPEQIPVSMDLRVMEDNEMTSNASSGPTHSSEEYHGSPILVGVVKDGENFDFCMCNPPFFESIDEVGKNPRTSCGGTLEEMVCPGGEQAFITRIIEDSVKLKDSFRWYTTMVGRKSNLKCLTSKLREVGVSIVKTTEFVQGWTSRWGLAWSFLSPTKRIVPQQISEKKNHSFMLEGIPRCFGAAKFLQMIEHFFLTGGATCNCNLSSFSIDVTASKENCEALLNDRSKALDGNDTSSLQISLGGLSFRISVFEQIPGTLFFKGSLLDRETPLSGTFALIFFKMEDALRKTLKEEI
ncbi:hypothetical protein AMTRI_Chr09g41610 [Amborella trichopoda]